MNYKMAYEDVYKSIRIKDRIGLYKGATIQRHKLPLSIQEHEVENRIARVDNFEKAPGVTGDENSATPATLIVTNQNFILAGNNMTSALCTLENDGGILMTPDGGNTDGYLIKPHTRAGLSGFANVNWNTGKRIRFATTVKTGAKTDKLKLAIGMKLTDTTTKATDDDQAFFYHEDDGDNWIAITSNDGTDQELDTGVAVSTAKEYEMVIEVDANRVPRYYIDDKLVATGTALKANTNLIPVIAGLSNTDTSTTKTLAVKFISCSRDY